MHLYMYMYIWPYTYRYIDCLNNKDSRTDAKRTSSLWVLWSRNGRGWGMPYLNLHLTWTHVECRILFIRRLNKSYSSVGWINSLDLESRSRVVPLTGILGGEEGKRGRGNNKTSRVSTYLIFCCFTSPQFSCQGKYLGLWVHFWTRRRTLYFTLSAPAQWAFCCPSCLRCMDLYILSKRNPMASPTKEFLFLCIWHLLLSEGRII